MWSYEKRLQYPVDIKTRDPKIAQIIIQPYISPELEVVDELSETDRGSLGFGSSGK